MKGKRKEKTVISTGVVVYHCQVSYDTVKKWIRQGKLPAYETPSGQHRILIDDFQDFLDRYGMPPFEPPPPRRRKLLIVDDEPELVQMIQAFFTRTTDSECATAANGFEAGAKVMSFHPDLVILDLVMPGLNGIEVCRQIKTAPETQHILVLAMTGHPEDGNLDRVLAAGAEACLVKPFTLETLKQQVETLFEEQRRLVQARRKDRKVRSAVS